MNILFLLIVIIGISVAVSTLILKIYIDKKRNIHDQFGDIIKKNLRKEYKKALQKELDKPYYKN